MAPTCGTKACMQVARKCPKQNRMLVLVLGSCGLLHATCMQVLVLHVGAVLEATAKKSAYAYSNIDFSN